MHRLATVHERDNQPTNQPTTNDQRRHDTASRLVRRFWRHTYSFWQNSRTWQTDRPTDWQTDGQTTHDGIGRAYIASCDKIKSLRSAALIWFVREYKEMKNENCRNFDRSTQLNEPYKTTQMASSSGSARGYKIEKRPQDSPPTNTIYDLGRLTVIPSGIQSQFTNDQQSTAIYVLWLLCADNNSA